MHSPLRYTLTLALLSASIAGASAQTIDSKAPEKREELVASVEALALTDKPSAKASDLDWAIEKDERIDFALQRWATRAGWVVTWAPLITWECPARTDFHGSFDAVATQVIEALNQDGKRLRLRIFDSGRVMEVVSDASN